jgi:hypothetical protein
MQIPGLFSPPFTFSTGTMDPLYDTVNSASDSHLTKQGAGRRTALHSISMSLTRGETHCPLMGFLVVRRIWAGREMYVLRSETLVNQDAVCWKQADVLITQIPERQIRGREMGILRLGVVECDRNDEVCSTKPSFSISNDLSTKTNSFPCLTHSRGRTPAGLIQFGNGTSWVVIMLPLAVVSTPAIIGLFSVPPL